MTDSYGNKNNFDLLAIKNLSIDSNKKAPGGTSRLVALLKRELERQGLCVVDLDENRDLCLSFGARALAYYQTQGYLNGEFRAEVESLLAAGIAVVEHNIFGLPSKWRSNATGYYHLVPSVDTGYRYSTRQRFRRPLGQPQFYVLNKTTGVRGQHTSELDSQRAPNSFLRVGRPDRRKWSSFELDFMSRLASENPGTHFNLTLVGYPFPAPSIQIPNLDVAILPYQADLAPFLAAHSTYLHDSRIGETYGNSIAEAASAGLEVITTLSLYRDAGHLDIVRKLAAVVGTKRGLIEHATDAWIESKKDRSTPFFQYRIEDFSSKLLCIAGGNLQSRQPSFREIYGHYGAIQKSIMFGRAGPRWIAILWLFLRTLRRWNSRD